MPFFYSWVIKWIVFFIFLFSFYHNVFTLYFSLNFLIIDNEIIFKIKVTINNINPKAKAERVSGELNSKSPTKLFTIVTVTVVISSSGFQERFGLKPAAITTIIVSPKARESARSDAEIIPGIALGITIFFIVSPCVIPRANAAFL